MLFVGGSDRSKEAATMRYSTTTNQEIINALRRAGAERGRWWTTREWEADGRAPSFSSIRVQFGTWRAAWAAAGYEIRDRWKNRRFAPRGTWSPDAILAAMQEQANADGTVPTGSLWNRRHNRPSLLTFNATSVLIRRQCKTRDSPFGGSGCPMKSCGRLITHSPTG